MSLDLGALRSQPIQDLVHAARGRHIENPSSLRKPELVAALLREQGPGAAIDGNGLLEVLPDGFGFLRAPEYAFAAAPDDVYVSPSQIRRFNLRNGDLVSGQSRGPKESERYFALVKVESVNGRDAEAQRDKVLFDNLVAVPPTRRIDDGGALGGASLAFGQRVLVTGVVGARRAALLDGWTRAVAEAHPDVVVLVALLGQRPEDATVRARALPGLVAATTFDEPDARHVQVVDMLVERARRLVELGKDVVLVVDDLGRAARAVQAGLTTPGRLLAGGLDVGVLPRVRRLLASGRAVEGGGSLTLVAAATAPGCVPLEGPLTPSRGTLGRALREGAGPLPSQEGGEADPYDAALVQEILDHVNVEIRVRAAGSSEDPASPGARVVIEGA